MTTTNRADIELANATEEWTYRILLTHQSGARMIWSHNDINALLNQAVGTNTVVAFGKDDVSVTATISSESFKWAAQWAVEQAELLTAAMHARQLVVREIDVMQTSFLHSKTDALSEETGLSAAVESFFAKSSDVSS